MRGELLGAESFHYGFDTGISSRKETDETEQDDEYVFRNGPFGSVGPESDQFEKRRKDEGQEGTTDGTDQRDEQVQFRDESRQENLKRMKSFQSVPNLAISCARETSFLQVTRTRTVRNVYSAINLLRLV